MMIASMLARLLLCAGLMASPLAHAGRSCEAAHPPQAQTVVRGLNLAERTLAALDASGQRVVVLARAGQDLSKYGVYYRTLALPTSSHGSRLTAKAAMSGA